MKSIGKTLFLSGIATAVLLASCRDGAGSDNSLMTFSEVGRSAAYRFNGWAKDFGMDKDAVYFDSVSMLLPGTINGTDAKILRDSIVSLAFDTTGVDIDNVISDYFLRTVSDFGYKLTDVTDSVKSIAEASGFTLINGGMMTVTPAKIVYNVTSYSYPPGAAHGMTVYRYINYMVKENRIVGLDDIFTPEGLAMLPEVLQRKADMERAILGTTAITALPADGNFYLTSDDAIVFAYQPYEVASFAQGQVKISFYLYELSDYMSDEGRHMFGLYSADDAQQ